MKRIVTLLVVALFCTINSVQAQLTSGSIKMEITDFGMPGMDDKDGMAGQMESMMKGMSMTINFRPGEQVTEMSMMGMMNMKQHFQEGMMIQYMDVMGQKIMIKTPTGMDAFKELGLSEEDIKEAYQITYDKSSSKNILGYDCYKATISMDLSKMGQADDLPEGMSNMDMILYISKDIKIDNFSMQQLPGIQLEGAPLSMEMDMGMMKMTYEATEINKSVDPNIFAKPEGDYREMSIEDMKKMGMNPGGFGF